jgi:hypothetical protein
MGGGLKWLQGLKTGKRKPAQWRVKLVVTDLFSFCQYLQN